MLDHCDRVCAHTCYAEVVEANWTQGIIQCLLVMCNIRYHPNSSTSELLEEIRLAFSPDNDSTVPSTDYFPPCSTDKAMRLERDQPPLYSIPLQGYLSPVLVFLTIINNTLVCIVLLKPHMRSPTNAILIAMALSDMFTGLFPVPVFLYFYATERYREWVPYDWCFAVEIFRVYIPTIFHTTSIWLTMALAFQRYIYVCHSFKARTWCTIKNVIIGAITILALATLSQFTCFFEFYFVETYRPSILVPNKTVSACVKEMRPWVSSNVNLYYNIYFGVRVVFIHLIPCVSLVVMNALLIHAMKKAQQRRMQLLRQNKKSESRKLKESNCTTLMLVAVVGLFLLVEFPLGLVMVFLILDKSFQIVIIEEATVEVASLFANFFILLSYPLNFFIYCGMSKQFRETFKRLFTGAAMPPEKEYSQYMTLPTENGKSTGVTHDETAL
ncbi:unnamed protein product [Candidula unifasciata]|uniref:G-protein coupled receptors family 1 profile domain-containing protein n=1 Tax=Candidula unifasciata TaxID=100452 RepID=A0A8S3YRA5_9EUPU|nr:unnamed protein product [Candidula unifasciata]